MTVLRRRHLAIASAAALAVAACGAAAPRVGGEGVERTADAPGAGTTEDAPADVTDEDDAADDEGGGAVADGCSAEMTLVDGRFCVDRWEASLVEIQADGTERPHPHYLPVDGRVVRAVSVPGVFPQGFISEKQADDACRASGKRLCSYAEWKTACVGPAKTTFPYGQARRPGVCHDTGKSAVVAVFGAKAVASSAVVAVKLAAPTSVRRAHVVTGRAAQTSRERARRAEDGRAPAKNAAKKKKTKTKTEQRAARAVQRPRSVDAGVWSKLNDPLLGQVDGALATTGSHPECESGWGVFDMVGNLHEWVATDPSTPHGTFAGGYYLDTSQNGDGCNYRTRAHAHDYHDYSTGFRCCADLPHGDR